MTPRVLTDEYAVHLARAGAAFDLLVAESPGDPVARRAEWTAALDVPLPMHGAGADVVVDQLVDVLVPNGVRLVEPGFWGWITSGATTVPTIAALTASVAGGQRYGVTAFNLVEQVSLRWLAELCGLDPTMQGVYSSGGSTANLVALGAARQSAFEQRGIDVAGDGTGGARCAVYASAETHHTVQRAAGVLGIGRSHVRLVETDGGGRMRPDRLREAVERDLADGVLPVAVVAHRRHDEHRRDRPDPRAGRDRARARRLVPRRRRLRPAGHPRRARGAPLRRTRARRLRDRRPAQVAQRADRGGGDLRARPRTCSTAPSRRSRRRTSRRCSRASRTTWSTPSTAWACRTPSSGSSSPSPSRGVVVWSILRELGREGVAARIREDNDFAPPARRARPPRSRASSCSPSRRCRSCASGTSPTASTTSTRSTTRCCKRLQRETPYLPSSTRVDGVLRDPPVLHQRAHDARHGRRVRGGRGAARRRAASHVRPPRRG